MTEGAEVAVVVVTYNSAAVVDSLLDSLPAALAGITAVTTVVDNGSTDGTVAALRRRQDCLVVESTNRGYSAGINLAVAAGPRTSFILVLNPDVVLHQSAIERLVSEAVVPGTAAVAPRTLTSSGQLDFTLRREPSLLRAAGLNRTGSPRFSEYVSDPAAYDTVQTVDWAVGSCLLLVRDVYEELGGWDESYFMYSEETDFLLRARDAGYATRYRPDAVVTHLGGGSGRSAWTHTLQIFNRVRLYRRRHPAASTYCYLGLSVLSEMTWLARGHPQSGPAIHALVRPSARPPELYASKRLLPD